MPNIIHLNNYRQINTRRV